eukprot:768130-Hanusia_phi.AAC.2
MLHLEQCHPKCTHPGSEANDAADKVSDNDLLKNTKKTNTRKKNRYLLQKRTGPPRISTIGIKKIVNERENSTPVKTFHSGEPGDQITTWQNCILDAVSDFHSKTRCAISKNQEIFLKFRLEQRLVCCASGACLSAGRNICESGRNILCRQWMAAAVK